MRPAGFVLLVEHGQHIALLDDAAAGKLLKSLFRYAKDGSTSELPADAAVAFSPCRRAFGRVSNKQQNAAKPGICRKCYSKTAKAKAKVKAKVKAK